MALAMLAARVAAGGVASWGGPTTMRIRLGQALGMHTYAAAGPVLRRHGMCTPSPMSPLCASPVAVPTLSSSRAPLSWALPLHRSLSTNASSGAASARSGPNVFPTDQVLFEASMRRLRPYMPIAGVAGFSFWGMMAQTATLALAESAAESTFSTVVMNSMWVLSWGAAIISISTAYQLSNKLATAVVLRKDGKHVVFSKIKLPGREVHLEYDIKDLRKEPANNDHYNFVVHAPSGQRYLVGKTGERVHANERLHELVYAGRYVNKRSLRKSQMEIAAEKQKEKILAGQQKQ